MTVNPHDFTLRHIGPDGDERDVMLATLGVDSLDALIDETIPASLRTQTRLDWPAMSEHAMLQEARALASCNRIAVSLIGQGYYGTVTPPVIQRNILENPAWYTAYTPYQPEISQGRLEALLNFQTVVCDLTGLEIANASLLDEATACAEAMAMAQRVARSKSGRFFVDANCHPQNITVMETRAAPLGIEIIVGDPATFDGADVFGAIVQYPDTTGAISDPSDLFARLHANGALAIMATDLLALTLLKEPGALGADIAVGSAQRFGVPMGFGGPHAAFFACRDDHKRAMPGRLVGVSVDAKGQPALRLALQTREQHIRREKASSNVCTAQALLAVMASFYAVFHGAEGLTAIATRIHEQTRRLALALTTGGAGYPPMAKAWFDTITVDGGPRGESILALAYNAGINLRDYGDGRVGIALDETVDEAVLARVAKLFGAELPQAPGPDVIPPSLRRTSPFLTHPTFNGNRSETAIMRLMRRLADRDLALDRAMIPLGSCTMKLNAAAEMMPVTWPEFGALHPLVPSSQAEGYHAMFADLQAMLCAVTGYDAVSLQPNSGAQGEYAGLMTIRAYHASRGEADRDICLIPVSAHGTNPASAQMAGMQVVVVKSAANGDVDLDDFRAKAEEAGDRLAATMITYPSTHGVFEETVRDICAITHAHGGQVYLDGANMNAMVGLVRPGDLGSDVSHLNLHKTFCIPHGGGGPGMGPIGVKSHLIPYLPGDPADRGSNAVSAATYGSASILPISWAYCRLMGGSGLTEATKVAILNANYVATRLSGAYDILYTGPNGRIAHECIVDLRPFVQSAGISVEDVAKRLIDYGFHAPTMSWPVAGTLMIEPTESEPKAELDRFVDAMLAIREEIRAVEEGRADKDDNVLKNAPHTIAEAMQADWPHPYDRMVACFPAGGSMQDKYWPPVARVDNPYGDRNLVCTCPPLTDYRDAAE